MVIYLHDSRPALMGNPATIVQHVCAAGPLFFVALAHLQKGEGSRAMALVEVAIAMAVVITFVLEVRAARHHAKPEGHGAEDSPVGWFDLAAGALLIHEAFAGSHMKPGYMRPQFFSGLVAIGLGVFHRRLHKMRQHRRYVEIGEKNIDFHPSRFRNTQISWADISSISLDTPAPVIHLMNGKQRSINLDRFHNCGAVWQAICEKASTLGVSTNSTLLPGAEDPSQLDQSSPGRVD